MIQWQLCCLVRSRIVCGHRIPSCSAPGEKEAVLTQADVTEEFRHLGRSDVHLCGLDLNDVIESGSSFYRYLRTRRWKKKSDVSSGDLSKIKGPVL